MSISSSPPPEKNFRVLALTAVVFALASGILSLVGFHGIYGQPEGSEQTPSDFTEVWPIAAQLGLWCLSAPMVICASRGAGLPGRTTEWLTRHYRTSLLVLVVFVALGLRGCGSRTSRLSRFRGRVQLPVRGCYLPSRPIVEPTSAGQLCIQLFSHCRKGGQVAVAIFSRLAADPGWRHWAFTCRALSPLPP